MLFRVSTFMFDTCSTLLFPDEFSNESLIPICSPQSEIVVTLVASRPEDAFIDQIAYSILGATMPSIAVETAFWIRPSTVSTKLLISVSILSLRHLFKVLKFTVFSSDTRLSLEVPTIKSRSLVPSLITMFSCLSLAALPIIKS